MFYYNLRMHEKSTLGTQILFVLVGLAVFMMLVTQSLVLGFKS